MSRSISERVRRFIDRGLARYGRGELREAIVEWQEALILDEANGEAASLIEFVQRKLEGEGEKDQRTTDPVIPSFDE